MRTILIPRRSNPQERKSVFYKPSGVKVGVGVGNAVRVIGGVGMRTMNVTRSGQPRESVAGASVVREGVRPLRLGGAPKATVETAAGQSLAVREEQPKAEDEQKPLETMGAGEAKGETIILEPTAGTAVEEPVEPLFNPEAELLSIPMPSDEGTESIGGAKGKRRGKKHRKNR